MSCWETSSSGFGRAARRVAAVTVALASVVWSSSVDAAPTPAERAAQEIQAARDRADAAAQAVFDTEAEIDRLNIEIEDTREQLAEIEADLSEARSGLEYQAIRSFVGAGGPTMPLLIDLTESNDVLTAGVYSSIATETVHVDIDDFDALLADVGDKQNQLEQQQAEAAAATETFAAMKVQAEAEVVRLGEIEEQRLKDEAVRLALEAQQRARAEQARQEAEAQAAAAQAAAAQTASPPSSSSGSASTNASAQASMADDEPVVVAPVAPPQSSGVACPVAGPRAFADTWGAPRSGGRSHQGVDLISPSGTPLVAMESGRVEYRSNALGGKTLRLYGNSGTRYYYAHLSRYEGGNRTVNKGDVVGYVGRTGNTTTNHLHLQIHPNGGQPINPYPITRAACG